MFYRCVIVVSCVLLSGCEPPAGAYDPKPPPVAAPPMQEKVTPPLIAGASATAGDVTVVRVPAKAGAVDPSRYDANIATSPLTAHFSIQQQLIFDGQIPKAMQIFEGVRNRKPSSHQEFMTEIIGKNGIKLPPLPPQHRYIYDPARGELMIESPQVAD